MRQMLHKVKTDQVYFSICKVKFLLYSTHTVLTHSRISLQSLGYSAEKLSLFMFKYLLIITHLLAITTRLEECKCAFSSIP